MVRASRSGFSWLPFLAADFGCLFGGLLAATLQKYAGTTLINARRWAFTVGAELMVSVAFAGWVNDPYLAILLFSLAGFAHQTLSVTVITMASDLFPRSEVATVAGLAGTCGNAGVLLFTLMVGVLVTRIGYSPFFACPSIPRHPRGHRPVDPRAGAKARMNITNPILRGFNRDPSIVRVDDDYYIATSTFEWYSGVQQIHHSRDLVHWQLLTRPPRRASQLDLRGDPDSCGVWAPCVSHADGLFYLVYTDVKRYGRTSVGGSSNASPRDSTITW